MKRLVTLTAACIMLATCAPAFAADHPIVHAAGATKHAVARAWHGAARHGQKFMARNSWSRRRRGYHMRKAAGHAYAARKHSNQMHRDAHNAANGH